MCASFQMVYFRAFSFGISGFAEKHEKSNCELIMDIQLRLERGSGTLERRMANSKHPRRTWCNEFWLYAKNFYPENIFQEFQAWKHNIGSDRLLYY